MTRVEVESMTPKGPAVSLDELAAGFRPSVAKRCRRCGVTRRGRFTGWGWLIRHRIAACHLGHRVAWDAWKARARELRAGEEPW